MRRALMDFPSSGQVSPLDYLHLSLSLHLRHFIMLPLPATDIQVTVKIPYRVSWKLLQEYDNSGDANTTVTRSVQVTQSKEISGRDYTKVVNESSREEAKK